MLLGVPTISSDVGGIKNMLTHEKEGFIYQADAPYMLAYYIKKLFEDKDLQLRLSKNAQNHAAQTHNSALNAERLVEIYNIINRGIIK
jgi:glycosyltransferase involved in cell wall biosynthesis